MSDSLRHTCKILSLKHSNEPIPDENVVDRVFDNEELLQLSVADLKDICRQKGVPVSGNKTTLIDRILQGGGSRHSNAERPVLELLLEKWFMSPFASSTSMREGTLNESNVLVKLALFVDDHSELFTVTDYQEYGLLCAKDTFYAAFSPDGIVVVKHNEELHQGDDEAPTNFLALVEIKSKCTNATVQKETALAAAYGVFRTVVAFIDVEEFKQCVPEASYRCQLLHGMACGSLQDAFYVVASLSRIIRVVHVVIDQFTMQSYRLALQEVHDRELTWVLHGEVPNLDGITLTHAVDRYTITKALDLWRAISNLVKTRGRPLPPGRMLVPTIIAMWNRNKGPIDVFSRFMKNCHARHAQLSPLANIWLRLLMSRVYNAYQSFVLSRSAPFLLSVNCTGYASFQANRKLHGSFAKFCSALAKDLCLEVTGDSPGDESVDDISVDEDGQQVLNSSGTSVVYNKRDMYFTNREMIRKRMNKSLPHVLCRIESNRPTSCVWCCRKKHDQPEQKHSRHGRCTKFWCPVCVVSLCRVKRFNGMSCHELFHTSTSLMDCCTSAMDATVHVMPHRNRRPPPIRGRPSSDAEDEDGEQQQQQRRIRSRVTPVATRRVRRSNRDSSRASSRGRRR
jgi:hypothetical protein